MLRHLNVKLLLNIFPLFYYNRNCYIKMVFIILMEKDSFENLFLLLLACMG